MNFLHGSFLLLSIYIKKAGGEVVETIQNEIIPCKPQYSILVDFIFFIKRDFINFLIKREIKI